jgi:hypothetical protein
VALGGVTGAVDRFGPPLFRAIAAAVAPWNPHVDAGNTWSRAMLGLALWAVGSVAALLAVFRRREIES